MHRQRIYVDTSVIGGCLDEEFAQGSRSLLDLAREGEISLLLSDLLFQELEDAPATVAEIAAGLPSEAYELIETTMEAELPRQQYMAARIIAPPYQDDALHVAVATVSKGDLVVSWNFYHMLHVEKIRAYNAVNLVQGYQPIDIRSPREVIPI